MYQEDREKINQNSFQQNNTFSEERTFQLFQWKKQTRPMISTFLSFAYKLFKDLLCFFVAKTIKLKNLIKLSRSFKM